MKTRTKFIISLLFNPILFSFAFCSPIYLIREYQKRINPNYQPPKDIFVLIFKFFVNVLLAGVLGLYGGIFVALL